MITEEKRDDAVHPSDRWCPIGDRAARVCAFTHLQQCAIDASCTLTTVPYIAFRRVSIINSLTVSLSLSVLLHLDSSIAFYSPHTHPLTPLHPKQQQQIFSNRQFENTVDVTKRHASTVVCPPTLTSSYTTKTLHTQHPARTDTRSLS